VAHPTGVRLGGLDHLQCVVIGQLLDRFPGLAEEGGVRLLGVYILVRQLDIQEDRLDRADDHALLALDADLRVDVELRRVIGGMDAGDGADLGARPVPDAELGDDVRHARRPLLF
jgi:hypothetical protein